MKLIVRQVTNFYEDHTSVCRRLVGDFVSNVTSGCVGA